MILKKSLKKIREFLENSQNPVFFFDNDQDGLCSFLLLRKFLGRGKGVAVKSAPMTKEYFRRIVEFNSDAIFILDVPEVSKDFFEKAEEVNLPVIMVDHHDVNKKNIPKFVNYYNSFSEKKKQGEPVTYVCYKISEKKEDLWLGVIGCISDRFIPDFYDDFLEQFPELGKISKDAFDIFYNSDIGKIARIFGAGLKDRTTNVMNMIRFAIKSKSPYDFLNESKENSVFYKRFEEINSKLNKFVEKAKLNVKGNILFFKYAGDTSMSADLSNKLSHLFFDKVIVVAYVKGNLVNISIRGESIKSKVLKVIDKIENARGGGHNNAVGVQMNLESLDFFVEELRREI